MIFWPNLIQFHILKYFSTSHQGVVLLLNVTDQNANDFQNSQAVAVSCVTLINCYSKLPCLRERCHCMVELVHFGGKYEKQTMFMLSHVWI